MSCDAYGGNYKPPYVLEFDIFKWNRLALQHKHKCQFIAGPFFRNCKLNRAQIGSITSMCCEIAEKEYFLLLRGFQLEKCLPQDFPGMLGLYHWLESHLHCCNQWTPLSMSKSCELSRLLKCWHCTIKPGFISKLKSKLNFRLQFSNIWRQVAEAICRTSRRWSST